jgi:exonuclease SbcC
MIRRLRMVDFKVFEDQELLFKPGTTAIVGPNGSGKTTILEAIEFALFRSVTRKEKALRKVEEVIRHTRKKAKIELDFVAPINRREYRVVRTIHPGETNADLFLGRSKEPQASDPKRVDNEIVKLLGMHKNAFSALTYVRQGEIFKLSRDTPSKRRSGLYSMMGLGVYDKSSSQVKTYIKRMDSEVGQIEAAREQLEAVRGWLPQREEIDSALGAVVKIENEVGEREEIRKLKELIAKVNKSLISVDSELKSQRMTERPEELREESDIAAHLRSILEAIPDVAEKQLRPHIREEARNLFREIFGDRYNDLAIDDDYEVSLYDLQGNEVPLKAASGGEDVCVNFALRVAVNTALQKHSIAGPPPGLIILDEPGAGLDEQRRRWLPDAIQGLQAVEQVIVVTHMGELKGSTDQVISLTPQGKGRQPLVEM